MLVVVLEVEDLGLRLRLILLHPHKAQSKAKPAVGDQLTSTPCMGPLHPSALQPHAAY